MNARCPPPALDAAAVDAALHRRLRATLSPAIYTAWFARLRVASVRDVAVLTVPTRFLVSWLRRHHAATLRGALRKVAPSVATIRIELRSTSAEHPVPADPVGTELIVSPPDLDATTVPADVRLPGLTPDTDRLVSAIVRRGAVVAIQVHVARHYGLERRDMLSTCRLWSVVRPRQVAMYLAKILTPHSLLEIGRRFGGRDHTTVLQAIRRTEARTERDPAFAAEVADLRRQLETGA